MTVSKVQNSPFQKKSSSKKISWAIFEKKYLTREDAWKYEWVDGIIEKTKRNMYPNQRYILINLRKLFRKLLVEGKVSGSFESETDIFFSDKIHRRPDISYCTEEQDALMAHEESVIPEFVIEIVSKNDTLPKQNRKMKNYRDADVKVIWQIFPDTQEVQITTGKASVLCTLGDVCTAAPVLPDFKITVKDIFQKPPKPSTKSV